LRKIDRQFPRFGKQLHTIKQGLEIRWSKDQEGHRDAYKLEQLYLKDGETRAREYTGYRHVSACESCSIRSICDGVYGDYADLFGVEGLQPVKLASDVDDPQHYTRHQSKVIHPLDQEWLEQDKEPVAREVLRKLAGGIQP
jgi:hypothetical protein